MKVNSIPSAKAVLVVDPGDASAAELCALLHGFGYAADRATDAGAALGRMRARAYAMVLIEAGPRQAQTVDLLKRLKAHDPAISAIILSASATLDAAAEYIRHGAYDVIGRPVDYADLGFVLRRAEEKRALAGQLRRLKIRNRLLVLSIPLWMLLGYLLVRLL